MSGKVGICKKNKNGTVESQNDVCLSICGNRLGKLCTDGCMEHIDLQHSDKIFDEGFLHIRNVKMNDKTIDVVFINDGESLTTLQYDQEKAVEKLLAHLESYNLTNSELGILKLYLMGKGNKAIAEQLFISPSTLRTHLNNIYKKVPQNIKDKIIGKHFARSSEKSK